MAGAWRGRSACLVLSCTSSNKITMCGCLGKGPMRRHHLHSPYSSLPMQPRDDGMSGESPLGAAGVPERAGVWAREDGGGSGGDHGLLGAREEQESCAVSQGRRGGYGS